MLKDIYPGNIDKAIDAKRCQSWKYNTQTFMNIDAKMFHPRVYIESIKVDYKTHDLKMQSS